MKKRILGLLATLILMASVARADTFSGLNIGTNVIYYGAGSITVNGVLVNYANGSIAGPFLSSGNSCGQPYLNAIPATDQCEYVYYSVATNTLAHSSVFGTALPYVLAMVTTNSSGQPLTWTPYSLPLTPALVDSLSFFGHVDAYYAQPSSATPAFNRANGSIQYMMLNANVTSATLTGGTVGNWLFISYYQPPSGGPYTAVWPTNMHWPNGTPLTISSVSGSTSGAMCYYAGSVPGWQCLLTWSGVK